jgi:lipoprotein-anchoring transpeptidase ErfK/SrfK
MLRRVGALLAISTAVLLIASAAPGAPELRDRPAGLTTPVAIASAPIATPALEIDPSGAIQAAPAAAAPVAPPSTQQALENGVLSVVSIPTQRVFVFRDGALWGSAPVSTGKRGHATPAGVFPILQKAVHHRSTIYSGAPMPYMQRLTWGGVALHGGHVPGYRASHGCIRLPHAFARKLYAITDPATTTVMVTRTALASAEGARVLAGGRPESPIMLARVRAAAPAAPVSAPSLGAPVQTIQLAAAGSPENAAAYWQELVARRPELTALQHAIIPAVVNSRKVYRLRASGPEAGSICSGLTSAGVACLRVSQA